MKILKLISGLFLGFITGLCCNLFVLQKTKIVSSCQPEFTDYQSQQPYCVDLVKHKTITSSQWRLKIYSQADPDGVFYSALYPQTHHLYQGKNTTFEWLATGLVIKTPQNLELFIPASIFVGGR